MFKPQLNITIFMIIQLINMNICLRGYPVEVWVTVSPEFPLSPIVSDLNWCSRAQSMQAEDHSADPPAISDVVVRLSPAYPEQDLSSKARFRRLCSRRYRARGASDGDAKESSKQRERGKGLLNRNT
jgi:hypothetical protein